jgi:PTH1 family peptidyl-tRNA hydrolase
MKLIIGLGNPGEKYKNNRHNVGYMVIDKLKKGFKTNCFMNESGKIVKKLIEQYKVDLPNLWIIHDDLDIPLGNYKIQFGRGPKEHNGLKSIEEKLGTKDFWRVRIGIENRGEPHFAEVSRGKEYVLEDFTNEERKVLDRVIFEVCKKLATS